MDQIKFVEVSLLKICLGRPYHFIFLKAVFRKFTCSILEYFDLNNSNKDWVMTSIYLQWLSVEKTIKTPDQQLEYPSEVDSEPSQKSKL